VSRPGDCLVETAEFTGLLDEFGFKGVDFGEGELNLQQQVGKIDRAGLILGVHGSAMTNIVFLQSPATIIELFGRRVMGGFMDIADNLSLRYHGLLCDEFDDDTNIVVDCAKLRLMLRNLGIFPIGGTF
jgi:capsular polysaccharide biosynthesis protein